MVADRCEFFRGCATRLFEDKLRDELLISKHLVHHGTHAVNIFIADLHEDGAGICEKIAGYSETVAKIGQVAVDAVAPCIAEGFDLLRLTSNLRGVAVLYVATCSAPLEVAVEFD